ncbi:MAG TPA: hypothetical protein VME92_12870 [Acetobacteraceae bacterium]|nr:hypothetical protein [Acetobacteraceae bacterium]
MPLPAALRPAVLVRADEAGGDGEGAAGAAADVLCLASPDWLKHRLTVTGPSAELATFQDAAAGPGVIPWRLSVAELAERWFNRLVAVPVQERVISVVGAHRLTDQLRDAVEAKWASTFDEGRARISPLDLHALVPVPPAMLKRGPHDPATLAWLWENWGTTWPFRHVTARGSPEAGRGGCGRLDFRFHAADWSPWAAFRTIRVSWPALRFKLQPDYESPRAAPETPLRGA